MGRLHKHGLPKPTRRVGDDIVAISDAFPRAVRAGLVEFRPVVSHAEGRTVHFADGSSAQVDAIVHATGFDPAVGFLPDDAAPSADSLHRLIAHNRAPGLFFVGLMEAHRALLPIAGDQAAWVADVLSGRMVLPSRVEREREAAEYAAERRRDFGARRPFMVDHARYRATLRRDRRRTGRRAKAAA